jgi:hypothetical protein
VCTLLSTLSHSFSQSLFYRMTLPQSLGPSNPHTIFSRLFFAKSNNFRHFKMDYIKFLKKHNLINRDQFYNLQQFTFFPISNKEWTARVINSTSRWTKRYMKSMKRKIQAIHTLHTACFLFSGQPFLILIFYFSVTFFIYCSCLNCC